MSKSNDFENDFLLLVFNNTNIANIGDATGLRGSSTAGSFFIALHTADPGEAGNQSTSEVSYTGYARVAVARSSVGFTVTGSQVSNAATVAFGQCTGGTPVATHFSIGYSSAGATKILMKGALTASLNISNLIIPQFAAGTLIATED